MTNILDRDVPETDAELDVVLDRANADANADADAVPSDEPTEPTTGEDADPADDADHEAPKIKLTLTRKTTNSSRKGNQAWLQGEALDNFNAMMKAFQAAEYTRPEIKEMTGLTPSAVWRAENGKAHAHEVDIWVELFRHFKDGTLPPSAASLRPPKPAELKAKIKALEERLGRVAQVLANDDAKTVKQLRDIVTEAREVLSA